MKKFLIAGNWKMNKTPAESVKFVEELGSGLVPKNLKDMEVLVCPPFTSLDRIKEVIQPHEIHLGAQNCYHQGSGAFTGEISIPMLKDTGCEYIIIGHSERRHIFNESNDLINNKVNAVLEAGLKPIMCIGETLDERNQNKTFDILKEQIDKGLNGIDVNKLENLVFAYEPVWAIGTGISAEPPQIEEAHKWIRDYLSRQFGSVTEMTMILYGGSMKPKNAESILTLEGVNGGLIGGASLDPSSFLSIISIAESMV